MLRSSGNFIHCDIELHDFKIPTRKAALQVATEEEDRFFIIPVG
tara:strand:+ start:414 stop:545 length:132 start_codon:yes stop_codon:yes gene_type:complete